MCVYAYIYEYITSFSVHWYSVSIFSRDNGNEKKHLKKGTTSKDTAIRGRAMMKCTENVLKALWQQIQQQIIAALNAMEAKKSRKQH